MDRWASDMEVCLRASKVEIFMICKYVDDINLATTLIPPEYTWKEVLEEGKKRRMLVFSEETERHEAAREKKESPEERTIRLIMEESSRQIKGIKFTYDIPEKLEDHKCPVLDLAVWLEGRDDSGNLKIRYTFYEKAISAPTVFHSKAAYNCRSKLVTLSEEMRHRLRNMDVDHSLEEVLTVTKKFCSKLANSGYNQQTR